MLDNIIYPEGSPRQVLRKHFEKNPKISIVVSLTESGEITYDVSAPGEVGQILMLKHVMDKHINAVVESVLKPGHKKEFQK